MLLSLVLSPQSFHVLDAVHVQQHIGQHSSATPTFPLPSVLPRSSPQRFFSDHLKPLNSNSSLVYLSFFLPSAGDHFMACFEILFLSIRQTWPNHRNRFLLRMSSIFCIPARSLTVSFVILSLHVMPRIFLCHLWCAASNFFMFATVMGHVSAPYSLEQQTARAIHTVAFLFYTSGIYFSKYCLAFQMLNWLCPICSLCPLS